MIGDDYNDDCLGAERVGIGAGILVKTGKYRSGDERHVDHAFDSIREAVDAIVLFNGQF